MGGKYGRGGMYPSFNEAGQFSGNGDGDPKKKKKDKNQPTTLASSYTYTTPEVYTEGPTYEYTRGEAVPQWETRTYVPGETTTTTTDYMSEEKALPYMRAFARPGHGTKAGGDQDKGLKEISATEAFLNRLNEDKINTRLVDDEGNEITSEEQWGQFEKRKRRALREDYEKGLIDVRTYEKQVKLLDGVSQSFSDIIQSQGKTEATKNLYGSIAKKEDPEAHVRETLKRESHWFDPNDPQFGPGGFDMHNPGHVMIYQMKFNHLAKPGKEIRVDGKWGGETDSATVPISETEREELGGGVDPNLEMRFTEEKPKGGWDVESGGRPGSGGGYTTGRVRRGGGGGGLNWSCTEKGCSWSKRGGTGGNFELGGIMKTKFKDGGVYIVR